MSICDSFQLDEESARDIINELKTHVEDNWPEVCDEAGMTAIEREQLWQRAVMNPYCVQGKVGAVGPL